MLSLLYPSRFPTATVHPSEGGCLSAPATIQVSALGNGHVACHRQCDPCSANAAIGGNDPLTGGGSPAVQAESMIRACRRP